MPTIGIWQVVLILVIVLLLFGARKLPELAKGLGQSLRVFNEEMKQGKSDDSAQNETDQPGPETNSAGSPNTSDSDR